MVKRGQAALEFLTTYGWAFLVILVMIGALAYFGVLDPSKFIPQRCQFGAPLVCDGENYKATTTAVNVKIRNTLNTDFEVTDFQMKNDVGTYVGCTGFADVTVPVDGTSDLTCTIPAGILLTAGKKTRFQMKLIYHETTDTTDKYTKELPGEVYVNVQG